MSPRRSASADGLFSGGGVWGGATTALPPPRAAAAAVDSGDRAMPPDEQTKLAARVERAAEAALARQGYASAVDVLTGIGWLDLATLQRWQRGEVTCLEQGIQTRPARVAEAMRLLHAWATARGLAPSEVEYVARTPARPALRFTADGGEATERGYRTHWMSRELTSKQRERLEAKASRPPELVVIQPLQQDWVCHRCGGTGALLIMESAGPSCLPCAGLGGLEFLPAGDAALSRRAKAKSEVFAVVVRFSRARKRYERQGMLVQPEALREAERELARAPRRDD